jgi:ubiquinol-cytochrome c reductase cytochrome b subunit
MHYVSSRDLSFESINLLTRDVRGAWGLRMFHVVGSSGFFLFLILHLGRGLYYNSFKLMHTWRIGVIILVISMATAFLGYVLP